MSFADGNAALDGATGAPSGGAAASRRTSPPGVRHHKQQQSQSHSQQMSNTQSPGHGMALPAAGATHSGSALSPGGSTAGSPLGQTRVEYSPFKFSEALRPHPNTAEPNFCTLAQDESHWKTRWNGTQKGSVLYASERFPNGAHPLITPPAGTPVLYDIDHGPKQALATRVRTGSFCRSPATWGGAPRFGKTTEVLPIGPGQYSPARYPDNLNTGRRPPTESYLDKPLSPTGGARRGDRQLKSAGDQLSSPGLAPAAPASASAAASRATGGAAIPDGPSPTRPQTVARTPQQPDATTRPRTRRELQELLLRYQRHRTALQARRLNRKREDRESDPLIGQVESNYRTWAHRTNFGTTSVDLRGVPFPKADRFAEFNRNVMQKSEIPGPGQYGGLSTMIKPVVYKRDPRNEFPTASRAVYQQQH